MKGTQGYWEYPVHKVHREGTRMYNDARGCKGMHRDAQRNDAHPPSASLTVLSWSWLSSRYSAHHTVEEVHRGDHCSPLPLSLLPVALMVTSL